MGFHCIPDSCVTVVYREYLPPVIRYRYPGEDWQEIDGDDYAIEREQGTASVKYHAFGIYWSKGQGSPGQKNLYCDVWSYWRTSYALKGSDVKSWEPKIWNNGWHIEMKNGQHFGIRCINQINYFNNNLSDSGVTPIQVRYRHQSCIQSTSPCYGSELLRDRLVRVDGLPDTGECVFTVYKNGQIVHQETRDVCPEVEKLDCRLSDEYKQIKFNKFPYLERAEVVPHMYVGFVANIFKNEIPDECLNIYNNWIIGIPPMLEYPGAPDPSPYTETFPNFIGQICSAPGCPPPQYEVFCDCCESCPDGTCPVECHGKICCYNDYGVSVKEIPLDKYCGN